jgi:hypothetical protein
LRRRRCLRRDLHEQAQRKADQDKGAEVSHAAAICREPGDNKRTARPGRSGTAPMRPRS